MRARRTALTITAAGAVLGGAVLARRATRAPVPDVRTGTFSNGVDYQAIGSGPRTMLFLPGGPGIFPFLRARAARTILSSLAARGFTVWRLERRRNMPPGHTIADMADDVAHVIDEAFDGHVDAVVGASMGGLLALYLAARHPDHAERIVLLASAAIPNPATLESTSRFGEAMGNSRFTEAGEAFLEDIVPGDRGRPVRRLFGPLVGRMLATPNNPPDVLIETQALMDADARPVLPQITAPVLVIHGDQDTSFTPDVVEETVQLIPDCTLIQYAGRGHGGTVFDARTPGDIATFVNRDN